LAAPPIRVRKLHALLLGAAMAATSCADPPEPLASCEGEARTPAFCAEGADGLCQCTDCYLDGDAGVTCLANLELAQASCLPDGSDWQTCSCNSHQPRAVCLETCEAMRCDAACDQHSVLECAQRCDDIFERRLEGRHGVEPSEPCARAIARVAACLPGLACSESSICEDLRDWDSQEALIVAVCGFL
jgi:hypothetical protein